MPRTYKRKTHLKYTEKDLQVALFKIHDKIVSVANATVRFNIPDRTIYNKLSADQTNAHPSVKTILTKDKEELIVHINYSISTMTMSCDTIHSYTFD
jgi:hypothetical protein